ncbi:MAG: serine hydrolase [bacterium]|nr:serine hydrolase [bacterium]
MKEKLIDYILDELKLNRWIDQQVKQSDYDKIKGVLILRDGERLAERYYNGGNASSRYPLEEISYFIVALLVGAAIDRRVLRSVEVSISDHLPEFRRQHFTLYHRIKVKHLLTMSSGIEYGDDMTKIISKDPICNLSDEAISQIIKLPLAEVPGLHYKYKKVDIIILCCLLENVLGYSLREFCNDVLLAPLNIDASCSKDDQEMLLNVRDIAKLGQLVLQNGMWENRKIINVGFIRDMITPSKPNRDFGYQTRLYPYGYGVCNRNGSQIIVFPQEKLVGVIMAEKSVVPRYYGGIVSGILDFLH